MLKVSRILWAITVALSLCALLWVAAVSFRDGLTESRLVLGGLSTILTGCGVVYLKSTGRGGTHDTRP